MKFGKIVGSILIIVGTCVGAGILALPIVCANVGFIMAAILMLGIWALMTYTAFLILEVNLICSDNSNSFGTMAYKTLGKSAQIITWIVFLLLLYSLLSAYTAGATSLLQDLLYSTSNIYFPTWVCASIFVCVLGAVVFCSTKAVDYVNRFLLTTKGVLLFTSIALLIFNIDLSNIYYNAELHSEKYLLVAAPIFLCAFGFHVVIPSLRNYIGFNRKALQFIIFCGTTICLLIYLLWLLAVLGVVPLTAIKNGGNSIDKLVNAISKLISNKTAIASINCFASISMTTSFLGVALSIFDFLADGCKRANTKLGRLQTALITFIPPIIFVIYFPQGFVMALGYASIFVAILLVIFPAIMTYKLKKTSDMSNKNNLLFNKYILFGVIAIGIAIVLLQIIATVYF